MIGCGDDLGCCQNPILPAMGTNACRERAANSSMGMPIFSHSRMFSRFTDAANIFSFIRLTIDLGLTLVSILSG